jgi:quinol monooxygenase YgiN
MFGTVARMKLKPGSHEKMQDLMKGFEERQVNGFVFSASYRSQSDPDEIWLAVGFEDEASYRANADDPRTQQMAQQYQQLMAAPPEWHDGEIVSMNRAEDRAPTTRS